MYAVLRRAAPLRRRAVSALEFRETGAAGAAVRPQFPADGLEIAKLGISSRIVERLASKGVTKLYPSQVLGYEPMPHLSGAQVLPRWFSSLASNGSPVQKSQSDAQKSSEEATPKVVAFSPLEAAIAKPRSSPLTSESSKVRRSEIATQVTFYMIPALLLASKNSISTSLLVGAVFHQVYMFHKEILLDYVHHDITRKWSLIYFKLLLLVMAKDTIMYFNLF